jgi:hypothetical protein
VEQCHKSCEGAKQIGAPSSFRVWGQATISFHFHREVAAAQTNLQRMMTFCWPDDGCAKEQERLDGVRKTFQEAADRYL